MSTEVVLLGLAITSVLCAIGLLAVLLWPSKRKDVVRPTVPASRWPKA